MAGLAGLNLFSFILLDYLPFTSQSEAKIKYNKMEKK